MKFESEKKDFIRLTDKAFFLWHNVFLENK